ncbi:cytochrome P450 [Umezawaea endophytica]|uniref:Cytochrome P450 n=1 Tax=Umezawaea endophytica TaxID=1654476 RepID=A0A9X3A127_9PSEU|nr:cytochrome P450 [Umezawaea endophytica]MCS7479159.1 cytochrome P450 [Umezawaea endophytica]
MDYDLGSPEFYLGDPAPAYRALRHRSPVHWNNANGGSWAITRYEDIKWIGARPHLFSSAQGVNMQDPNRPSGGVSKMLITTDPPRHGALRRLVSKGFTPRQITLLEPGIRDIVRGALDRVEAGVSLEFAEGIVAPVPTRIIAEMIGAPHQDWEDFRTWSDAVIGAADPDIAMTTQEAFGAVSHYFQHLIELRESSRTNDLVSILLDAEVDGEKLADDEIVNFLRLLLLAGNETTRNLIALGTLALINHPDQRQKLVDDPALIPSAVEEMLRWITPVTHMTRIATEDVPFRDKLIKKGQTVVLLYGAANRDEDVFGADAEEFIVTRNPNPHLAFGTGEHACLGLSLARLEARVFFEELLSRFSGMELDGEVVRMRSNMVPGVKRMHVRLSPAVQEAAL